MMNKKTWVKERFWDFRNGHSTYLAFALSFMNFIVLNYNLFISTNILHTFFPSIALFAIFFIVTYFPLAIIIGYKYHRKKQLSTDIEIATLENPFLRKAIPNSKEMILTLPLAKLAINMNLALSEAFLQTFGTEILNKEQIREFKILEQKIDALIKGEKITANVTGKIAES